MVFDLSGKRIWVTGHRGMVGSALVRRPASEPCEVITAERELDLCRQADVEDWMAANKPQTVIMAGAKVGGIHANDTYPADFIYDNLMIEANVIRAAFETGVEKLLFLGSNLRSFARPLWGRRGTSKAAGFARTILAPQPIPGIVPENP